MAADDLFFLRTGEETGPFVLVRLTGGSGTPQGSAALEGEPVAGGDGFRTEGDLAEVLREAKDHALLNGLDLRIDLDGQHWSDTLGILGNSAAANGD